MTSISYIKRCNISNEEFKEIIINNTKDSPTLKTLSSRLNCDVGTVKKYIIKFSLNDRISKKCIPVYQLHNLTEEEFVTKIGDMIAIEKSLPAIAAEFNTSSTTIHKFMVRNGFSRHKELRDPKWLAQKYVVEKLSTAKIAKLCGVSDVAVNWHLKKNHIPLRTTLEARHNRDKTTEAPSGFHRFYPNGHPRSYCFWYDGRYMSSTPEYIFYKMHKNNHDIKEQPFVFENCRPDFLVDGQNVIEIKCSRKYMKDKDLIKYDLYGKRITEVLGYSYVIRYMMDEYPDEYKKALGWLRVNAKIGKPFTLEYEI
jgi:hypothetical protein